MAAAILFSTGGAGIKVEAFSAAQVSALRSGIAAVALLMWLRRRRDATARGALAWSGAGLAIAVVYAATLTLFVAATKQTTAANAIFLQSTAPLYILLLAPVFLGERFRGRDLFYLVAITAGMFLCFAGDPPATTIAPDPATGNLLGAAAGFTWALTLLALRYVERDPARLGVGIMAVVTGNVIASVAAAFWAWPFPQASIVEWATVVYLGVFQIGLAYICLTAAMRRLTALEASLLLLLEPVLNPVWTWLLRGEPPGAWVVAGGLTIVAATAGKSIFEMRAPTGAAAERT